MNSKVEVAIKARARGTKWIAANTSNADDESA
jgi:hypothetical protein